jgi:hypothetical protein
MVAIHPQLAIGARKVSVQGHPDPKHISTSYAERNNLHGARMTRLTNAFSKKVANHAHATALHFFYYNLVRVHQTLKVSPAMAAGITSRLWEIGDIVNVLVGFRESQDRRVRYSAQQCRDRARECEWMSSQAKDSDARDLFIELARQWQELARQKEDLEKN